MGVYIKGMEMPKSCLNCFLSRSGCRAVLKRMRAMEAGTWIPANYRHDDCPLVPVPKHGDLIDREALINDMANMIPWAVESPEEIAMVDGLSAGYEAVKDAPTVIEAEEGET